MRHFKGQVEDFIHKKTKKDNKTKPNQKSLLPGLIVFIQYKHSARLSDERDRYKQNNTALLSDIERMQIDSTTMAVDVKAL